MLHGMAPRKVSELQTTLETLNASVFDFYLTGSQFFGGFSEESDYDFFVKDTELVRRFLLLTGFTCKHNKHYDDPQCNAVMEKNFSNEVPVEIQLVRDCQRKMAAQMTLKRLNIMNMIPKEARTNLWRILLSR